jgi:hypothetical protein
VSSIFLTSSITTTQPGLGSPSAGSGVPSSVMIRLRVVAGEHAAMSWGGQALEVETKLGR